ncbi:MAG: citramalate synthase [bacterium]|nr:citramalate synthase [bacterium]MDD5353717.1 citramalate synthase [bacterium]MDD5755685.1 citramalate synthase [bacterium]
MRKIYLYDTTLRDGAQTEGISYSLEDKMAITQKLDELGIDYVEGGWPGSNPKDILYFQKAKKLKLKHAKVAAFGSTRHAKNKAEKDPNLKALIAAGTPVVTIFGKSWDLHVKYALRVSMEDNLAMIYDSVKYLKKKGKEVIYDAEHFFDGFKDNPEYAIKTLQMAEEAGADCLVLCDTNGGSLPFEVEEIVANVVRIVKSPLGIHAHNDADTAVANSVSAVKAGAMHVQGTINGLGERCGNGNLCSIIPALNLKMGLDALNQKQLAKLTAVSRYISEVANMVPNDHQPYVGLSAFTHKAGIHVSAVERKSETYEHIAPEVVGNHRRVLVSELSGKSNILFLAQKLGLELDPNKPETKEILQTVKELEHEGYQFEAAEASLEILIKKATGHHKRFFELKGFKVIVERRNEELVSEATIKLIVGGELVHVAAEGDGPVNALDSALRKGLGKFYPQLKEMHLVDYKVRVLNTGAATAAKVRVLIESQDQDKIWATVGVSENIIEASWKALVDSIEYKLLKK